MAATSGAFPLPAARRRRRVRFSVGLSALFLPVVMLTGISVAFASYLNARHLVTNLNQERLKGLARGMDWQLQERLRIPVAQRQIATLMDLGTPQPFAQQLERLKVLRQALAATPSISSYYLGYGTGERLQLRRIRSDADRGFFGLPPEASYLGQIGIREGQGVRTSQVVLDQAFRVLAIRPDPLSASFDPRQRPWYQAALAGRGPVATPIYRFASTGRLGITLAERVPGTATVVGADLPLDQANDVLLEISRSLSQFRDVKLALVGPRGNVVALNQPAFGAFREGSASTGEGMKRLTDASAPVLARLGEDFPVLSNELGYGDALRTTSLSVDGKRWEAALARGVRINELQTYLLVAIPAEELFAGARRLQQVAVLTAFLVLLVAAPVVLLIARLVTRQLRQLAREAQAVQNFDFDAPRTVDSVVSEIDELATSFDAMKGTIRRFLGVSAAIAAEPDFERLLVRVLDESIANSRAQGGALFLNLDQDKLLDPELVRSAAGETLPNTLPKFPLKGIERLLVGKAAGSLATTGRISREGGTPMERKLAGALGFDEVPYVSLPLLSRAGELLGMLLLWFKVPPAERRVAFMEAFSSTVATTLETRQLIRAQKALFEAFIELIAGSIDAKSPYTGGHCNRVPELTKMLAKAACEETEGPFASFSLSDDRWEAVHVAAWLHDCGKVVTPEYVVDKATKLETIYDRIHEVRMRFEVLKRDAWIRYYQALQEGGNAAELAAEREAELQQLDDDFAFVAECNQGGEFMSPDRIERLRAIAARTWLRTLDDRLGISNEELRRKELVPAAALPVEEPLLADRPDHRIERLPSDRLDPENPWGIKLQPPELLYDRGELKNLSISRGTLTDEERYKINEHIIHTIRMLSALPFPRHMKDVPELAGGHHETLIGTGYPKGLKKEEMSEVARMMAIADIFEALTAADRPYKPMKTLSQALKIMTFMRKDQHIDPDLFALFIRSGVYRRYAEQFLKPEQIDAVDEEALLAG